MISGLKVPPQFEFLLVSFQNNFAKKSNLPLIHEKMEVTPMIGIVYRFGYPLLLALPDLTAEVNYFDDLKKKLHFLLNRLQLLHKLFTHYIFGHQRTGFAIG